MQLERMCPLAASASAARSMSNFEIYDRDLKFGVSEFDGCWCRAKRALAEDSSLGISGTFQPGEELFLSPPEMAILGNAILLTRPDKWGPLFFGESTVSISDALKWRFPEMGLPLSIIHS